MFNSMATLTAGPQTLPTYTWLSNQGITPDSSTTYTLASLNAAIVAESGVSYLYSERALGFILSFFLQFTPAFGCSGSNLNTVAYYFHLRGSIIDGSFVPISACAVLKLRYFIPTCALPEDSPASGTCPSSGIKYPLKTRSTTTGLPTKATIHASSTGGLLSLGTWSTQTLATYTLTGTMSSFTMTSSKGNCGVSGGKFACGSGVALTSFSAVSLNLHGVGGPVADEC
jgi:ribonuclease T2